MVDPPTAFDVRLSLKIWGRLITLRPQLCMAAPAIGTGCGGSIVRLGSIPLYAKDASLVLASCHFYICVALFFVASSATSDACQLL